MKIGVEMSRNEGEALLKFLQRVGLKDLEVIHEGLDWPTFDTASQRFRMAIMDALEPKSP